MSLGRLAPCAGHAGIAVGLVLPHQRADHGRAVELRAEDPGHALERAPAAGRSVIVYRLISLGHDVLHRSELIRTERGSTLAGPSVRLIVVRAAAGTRAAGAR